MPRKHSKGAQKSTENLTNYGNLPNALINHACHIELTGNQEAIVEGCTGIIEYNTSTIRLNTAKFILKFTGRNLQVTCMAEASILVKGFIIAIEYM